ncbi:tyrosine-type recombinase/integrase [Nocardioides sp. NBC_00163]|uniref:tyrosine-type recombinase/integrase n=1 Tax=Nocardioides sp. NBC_00163 TaxID=2975999 RepID=UPI00324BE5F3
MAGRPRTTIGTYGTITTRRCKPSGWLAETRVRDADGRLRQVRVRGRTSNLATARLKNRLLTRPAFGAAGVLRPDSAFDDLADEWLGDLEIQDLADRTREAYQDRLRLHVRPAMEHYTLGEITTGRVERFLKSELAISYSQASHSRTVLNLLFAFALRHDAITRNPVEGTSPLPRPKNAPKALTLVQIAKLRQAAATWRTEPGLPGPRSDGQVRDIIEVLLGTAMRPGEVLALRPCDVTDGPRGMVAHVSGTVVFRKKKGVVRQTHPKTDASDRYVPVPEFAAVVIRRRLTTIKAADRERTVFANRIGGPLSPYNVRRTFREFVVLAGLEGTGISLRWYRRTGATVLARGLGTDAAATFLGHTSSKITEGYYIEPDLTVDQAPAALLDRTLRSGNSDGSLLAKPAVAAEEDLLDEIDQLEDGVPGDAVGADTAAGAEGEGPQ